MPVFDAATVEFLEGGCSLIVGSVGTDGEPYATRGWGLDVVDARDMTIRVFLSTEATPALEALAQGGRLAITAADVPTLRALQLKGRSLGVHAATAADRRRSQRHRDAFFRAVSVTDGTPRELLDRIEPPEIVVCDAAIGATYDQTPGPKAGIELGTQSR